MSEEEKIAHYTNRYYKLKNSEVYNNLLFRCMTMGLSYYEWTVFNRYNNIFERLAATLVCLNAIKEIDNIELI